MNITITPASLDEKPILERLLQLYLYDFSEFDEDDVDEKGLYPYPELQTYWEEPNRLPFFIRAEGKIAGFVLLRLGVTSLVEPPQKVNYISEFFIMKKYRKNAIGERAARWVFDQYPGDWEVEQIGPNLPAQAFWRKVIQRYTGGHFRELNMNDDNHDGPVQIFSNR